MFEFIRTLQAVRGDYTPEQVLAAAEAAYEEMYKKGIVAVGDICNDESTVSIKQNRDELYFHSFIELFGLLHAQDKFDKGIALKAKFQDLPASLTLHAPYSISEELKELTYGFNSAARQILSVHFLESAEERQIFEEKAGTFLELFRIFGVQFDGLAYDAPFEYLMQDFTDTGMPYLLVHNTELHPEEFNLISKTLPEARFVLCPKANLYINQKLPDLNCFTSESDSICLGTDSLASNDSLDLLEEMKCLQQFFPETDTSWLLRCATRNGAKALGVADRYGSFEKGRCPGINWISEIDHENIKFKEASIVKKLA